MNKQLCPKCKGNRTVFNWSALMLTIGLPIVMLVESDHDENDVSITKRRCPVCKGKGVIDYNNM